MTEHEARQLCITRGRNPDREMSGPDGPMKAWHTYMHPTRTGMAYLKAYQRDTMNDLFDNITLSNL